MRLVILAVIVMLFTAPARAPAQVSNGDIAATRLSLEPAFGGRHIREVSRMEALAYARRLRFDTTALAADIKTLALPSGASVTLTIAPQIEARELSEEELANGHIISRVSTDAAFPGFGLLPGTNYLWLDRQNGQWRILTISADGARRAARPAIVGRHSVAPVGPPASRIIQGRKLVTLLWYMLKLGCVGDSSLWRIKAPEAGVVVDSLLDAVHASLRVRRD